MTVIRRNWTPRQADEWTKEDWIAVALSPLAYTLILMGSAMSLLLLPWGFVLLAMGIIAAAVMFWVIGPKLDTLSADYEKKQKHYLEQLEQIQRWEED